jgi:ubiquinone biosynthesis protein
LKTLALIPDLIKRLDDQLPRKGGAPPPPPLPEIELIWERRRSDANGWRFALTALIAAAAGAVAMWALG